MIIPFGDDLLETALSKKWSGRIIRVAIEGFSLSCLGLNDQHFAPQGIEPDYISQIDMQNNFIFFEGSKFKLPLEGRHNAMNFLMALAVATELGLSIKNLDQLKIDMPMGRNRLVDCGQYLVLDETYNACLLYTSPSPRD